MESAALTPWKGRPADRVALLVRSVAVMMALGANIATAQPDESCKPEVLKLQHDSTHADSLADRATLAVCVENVDSANRQVRLNRLRPEALRLAQMFFDIPEYHDEGRLPVLRAGRNVELGPLAGIYASPFLLGFTRPAQIYEQGPHGTLAGIVVVDKPLNNEMPPSYKRLRLRAGLNCIWLAVDKPPQGMTPTAYLKSLRWHALVSHPAPDRACSRMDATEELPVVAVRSDRFPDDASYPAVARFDLDGIGNPIMGLRCLSYFCEIGVANRPSVRAPYGLHRQDPQDSQWDPKSGATPEQARRQVVKAWHDEQPLAYRDAQFVWRQSDVEATIRPIPEAALYDSENFENHWLSVAVVDIQEPVPKASKYYQWGLRQGIDTVQFRYSGNKWKARIVRDDGAIVEWPTMKRTLHYDVSVPAIARFRWTIGDEGVWAPCGNACCRASGELQ